MHCHTFLEKKTFSLKYVITISEQEIVSTRANKHVSLIHYLPKPTLNTAQPL